MKAIITLDYRSLVLELKDAVAVIEALTNAERYDSNYHPAAEGGTTHHIWDDAKKSLHQNMTILTDEQYRLYKLAGEPPKRA